MDEYSEHRDNIHQLKVGDYVVPYRHRVTSNGVYLRHLWNKTIQIREIYYKFGTNTLMFKIYIMENDGVILKKLYSHHVYADAFEPANKTKQGATPKNIDAYSIF